MLGKLLKHELYATGRIMLPMLAALTVLAGLANLSGRELDHIESNFINIILFFVIAIFFLGLFAVCVMAVVIMVQRFYKNLMGEEGYLMLTLPASLHGVVWSKLLVATLWIIVTGLVATVLFILTVLHFSSMDAGALQTLWSELAHGFRELSNLGITGGDWTWFISALVIGIILSAFAECLHFYAAMAMGHCFNKDKVLLSVVFYIVIAFGWRMLVGLSATLTAGINENAIRFVLGINSAGISSVQEGVALMRRLSLLGIMTELIHGAILYALTVIPMKKWLNLA